MQDVSESHQAQEALRESETLLRAVMDTVPCCIFVKNWEGEYLLVNKYMADLHLTAPDEMIGKTDEDFSLNKVTTTEEARAFLEHDREVIKGRTQKIIDNEPFTLPDGTVRWFQTYKTPFAVSGASRCVLGVALDITEIKMAQEEAERTLQLLTFAVEQVPAPVIIVGKPSETISFYNNGAAELADMEPSRLKNFPLRDYFRKRTTYRLDGSEYSFEELPLVRALNTGETVREEEYVISLESREHRISEAAAPLKDKSGNIIAGIAVFLDVTLRRSQEEKIRRHTRELQSLAEHLINAWEEQSTSIAREIHDELGQYLTSMDMIVTLLEQDLDIQPPNVKRAKTTLNELRDVIKMTVDSVRLLSTRLRPVMLETDDLPGSLEWLVSELKRVSGMDISYSCDGIPKRLSKTKTLAVFRIVQEALTNVVRHSSATTATVELAVTGEKLVARVKDNGVGFDASDIVVSESIGLLGMRERARMCSGDIRITSRNGEGTHVELTLPV